MSSGWPLRLKCPKNPEEYPMVAKFNEVIGFESVRKPLKMYMKVEDIIEESEDPNSVKDTEYYKRKKLRRRSFKENAVLVVEDSTPRPQQRGPPIGLQYEGILSNFGLKESSCDNFSLKSVQDASFKYVFLQVVKIPYDKGKDHVDSSRTEVNVIPVGGTSMVMQFDS
jgi:hypothetical protein